MKQDCLKLEVIIPVKDRFELKECVQSLSQVSQVIICDGGSTDTQCLAYLQAIEQQPNIKIIRFPESGFNKARLINQGIAEATSEFILISDADIIWNEAAINLLLHKVSSEQELICCVGDVAESNPTSVALKRDRYTYKVTIHNNVATVEVVPVLRSHNQYRPGCGLICARKHTLIKLGGYKEIFQGWGWEDLDLLIRATILKIKIGTAGKVVHISHEDGVRNQFHNNINPAESRNKNIAACLKSLSQGVLLGNL